MMTEYKHYVKTCDACEKSDDPIAIAGFSAGGFHSVGGKDLCDLCYRKFHVHVEAIEGFNEALDKFIATSDKIEVVNFSGSGGFYVDLSTVGI